MPAMVVNRTRLGKIYRPYRVAKICAVSALVLVLEHGIINLSSSFLKDIDVGIVGKCNSV